jgi:Tol biopolymer transport system component/DNA-binding winged helix-turn-helix (wHTH) protein
VDVSGQTWTRIRFGAFDMDRTSGELRKLGLRIKLQEQPLRILILMLDHAGEVIAREQLREHLWPGGTYVDFEHSLNAAIAKLRQALSDSAENPRFIETIPRRGYRFIAPLERLDVTPPANARPIAAEEALPVPTPALPSGRHGVVSGLAVLGVVALGIIAIATFRSAPENNALLTRVTSDSGLAKDPVISNDGKLIAYASDRKDGKSLDIWIQQAGPEGHAVRLTANDADEHQPTIAPDGANIVFRSEQDGGGIYRIPTAGGEPVLLAKGGSDPQFSPDGTLVAYWVGKAIGSALGAASSRRALFVVPAQGGVPREVQTDLRESGQPVWAPDGKHLIVYGSRGDATDLPMGSVGVAGDWWVVPVDGGAAAQTGALGALRKQGLSVDYPSAIPRPAVWANGSILFSGQLRGSTNLWSVPISMREWRITPPAHRLTFGSGYEVTPSISPTGTIAFASIALDSNIWALPVDANQARVTGSLRRITNGAWFDSSPSISLDGRRVVFDSIRSATGKEAIWIKDIETGREAMLASRDTPARHPEISRDGKQVAYSTSGGAYVVSAEGGPDEKFCGEECAFPWDWSPDGSSLLLTHRQSENRQLDVFDFGTRQRRPFLASSPYMVFQSRVSPDRRWLAFASAATMGVDCEVFVSPLENGVPAGRDRWNRISQPGIWGDKPRWSPDGNLLYLISEHDGFRCLWAQRLDHSTKRPAGAPISIMHFHSARLSTANIGYGQLEIGVAADKIVFNLGELTGNIWTITR